MLAPNRSAIKAARFFDAEVDEVIPEKDDERIDINDIDIWIDPLDATQVGAQLTCARGMSAAIVVYNISGIHGELAAVRDDDGLRLGEGEAGGGRDPQALRGPDSVGLG